MPERWFLCTATARTEVRLMAALDMITSTVWLTVCSVLTYMIYNHRETLEQFFQENTAQGEMRDLEKILKAGQIMREILLTVVFLRPAVSFCIAIALFMGAHKRCYPIVRLCLILSALYIMIDLILLIPRTIYLERNSGLFVFAYMLNFIYMLYQFLAVYYLMEDLKQSETVDVESDPNTDDTVVVEAERAGTPSNNET